MELKKWAEIKQFRILNLQKVSTGARGPADAKSDQPVKGSYLLLAAAHLRSPFGPVAFATGRGGSRVAWVPPLSRKTCGNTFDRLRAARFERTGSFAAV